MVGHYCVAGKEVLDDGRFGEWIRPVNAQNDDAISPEDMELVGGGHPELLDVISVPLLEHAPKRHQPENHQIDGGRSWTKRRVLGKQELPALADETYDIWRVGSKCKNDRVWSSSMHNWRRSLLLIRPESLTINAFPKQVRANFRYNGWEYNLAVTDPEAESRYATTQSVKHASRQIETDGVYRCLSLAAKSLGCSYYKLVAAIIGDAR